MSENWKLEKVKTPCNKEVFVKHEKASTASRFKGVLAILNMPMFWKIQAFGHFLLTSGDRNRQKAHLHAKTFHMSLSSCLYHHPLQRNSLGKIMFWKTAVFDILAKFGNFQWPNLSKTVKRHIYTPRPFTWAYSQVSTTTRYKDTALKRIDDRQTDRRTYIPNL